MEDEGPRRETQTEKEKKNGGGEESPSDSEDESVDSDSLEEYDDDYVDDEESDELEQLNEQMQQKTKQNFADPPTYPWLTKFENYYEILQVPHNADINIIDEAYYKLISANYPDKLPANTSHEKRTRCNMICAQLNSAVSVLLDIRMRELYDKTYHKCINLQRKSPKRQSHLL